MTVDPSTAVNSCHTQCVRLSQVRMSRIILMLCVMLVGAPLVYHYYLSQVEGTVPSGDVHRTRAKLEALDDFSSLKASDLKLRIEELIRIKGSVSSELRDLEGKKQRLHQEMAGYTQRIEELKLELSHQQTELERLKISVEQAQVAQREALQENTPELALPRRLLPQAVPEALPPAREQDVANCRMYNCFDYSRCSLTSGFPVYLYDPDQYPVVAPGWEVEGFVKMTLKQTLGYNPHLTADPTSACIYLVLVGEALTNTAPNLTVSTLLEEKLRGLPYWGGDGRNHILLNLARSGSVREGKDSSTGGRNIFNAVNTGRAIHIQSTFHRQGYRAGFDVVSPPVLGPPGGDVWQDAPTMLPARRKHLLSFQGEFYQAQSPTTHGVERTDAYDDLEMERGRKGHLPDIHSFIIDHLTSMAFGETMDSFLFHFECSVSSGRLLPRRGPTNWKATTGSGVAGDWSLCGTESSRAAVLRESTFVLVMSAAGPELVSTTAVQTRVYEALKAGAIPVLLGGDMVELPYSEVIDWRRAVLFLPKARITELHFFVRTIPDADILSLRRQGRLIWERYCSSVQSIVDTVVALLRDRIGVPPLPVEEEPSPSIFNASFTPLKTEPVIPDAEPEESLGPIEPPYPSPRFRRNFTHFLLQGHEVWNEWGDPFRLYPQLPFDLILPSDAKFIGSGMGFRPIGRGAGGAGKEFCESLGGNSPREQFTIVMLTYEREQILINSLSRLYGLPYLNKVIVVWNSPRPPLEDLRWPEIGVPVHVVKASRNSLNNRFLPFDAIETEAVLSVDDDAHLRHDEIMFGFRVWREQRDRVVGFPGRFHAWDLNHGGWLYNSNYSCELSMVLTGAAFVHKYYLFMYSYWLPQAVRDKVDEYMNCEDIAMNFLVSHITKKPPVKEYDIEIQYVPGRENGDADMLIMTIVEGSEVVAEKPPSGPVIAKINIKRDLELVTEFKVTSRWTFRCPGCAGSLSEDETHFMERHKCINFFTQVFGYTPLFNTQFRADSILFKTRIPHDKQKCFKFI